MDLTCYRHYVPMFAKIAKSVTHLTEEGRRFIWNENCQKALEVLKRHLASISVLKTLLEGEDGAINKVEIIIYTTIITVLKNKISEVTRYLRGGVSGSRLGVPKTTENTITVLLDELLGGCLSRSGAENALDAQLAMDPKRNLRRR